VLFSSRVESNPRRGFRFFGRSELPFHRTDEPGSWRGPGWYGIEEGTGLGRKAVSGWDEKVKEVARQVYLDRPAQLGTGTSILVVGFFEPREERFREPEEVASAMLESASRWFWPSMNVTPQEMRVSARTYDNGTLKFDEKAEINQEAKPFAMAVSNPLSESQVPEPGDTVERPLQFKIPARKPTDSKPGTGRIDASLTLRLRLAGPEDAQDLANRVAMMRGAGMVVKYNPVQVPLSDQIYHAVLCAGLARGDSEEDQALERFLRAAEPPSHNDWVSGTDRLREEYGPGAQAAFDRLSRDLKNAISQIIEERPARPEQGPQKLAELFPLSGPGDGSPQGPKFRIDELSAHLQDGVWHLKGRVRRPPRETGAWGFTVAMWLDAETGRGTLMPVAELRVNCGRVHRNGGNWYCQVDSAIREVRFEGRTEHDPEIPVGVDIYRTRARLEVNAKMEDGR
jgi:hypothetical protein